MKGARFVRNNCGFGFHSLATQLIATFMSNYKINYSISEQHNFKFSRRAIFFYSKRNMCELFSNHSSNVLTALRFCKIEFESHM